MGVFDTITDTIQKAADKARSLKDKSSGGESQGGFTPVPDEEPSGGFTPAPEEPEDGGGSRDEYEDVDEFQDGSGSSGGSQSQGGFTPVPDEEPSGGFTPAPDESNNKDEGSIQKAVSTARDAGSTVADKAKKSMSKLPDRFADATPGEAGGGYTPAPSTRNKGAVYERTDSGGFERVDRPSTAEVFAERLSSDRAAVNRVNLEEAKDPGVFIDRGYFETQSEIALSSAGSISNLQDDEQFQQFTTFKGYTSAAERRDKVNERLDTVDEQIERLQGIDSTRKFTLGSGENQRTVSTSEALNILQSQKQSLQNTRQEITENQIKRLNTITQLQQIEQEQRDTVTREEASKLAEQQDLDKFSLAFLGKDTGIDLEGGAAEFAMSLDTLTSGGRASAETLGAVVDPGKKPINVVERNQILESEQLKEEGYNPLEEAAGTVTSLPGLAGTAYAGGFVFGTGTKALQSSSITGTSTLAKGAQVAGVGLAGAETVRKGGQASSALQKGQEYKAVGRGLELGFELGDVYAGAKAGGQKLAASVGSTGSRQINVLRASDSGFTGSGTFDARTNVVRDKLQNPVELNNPFSSENSLRDSVSYRGFTRQEVDTVETTGRYYIDAGESEAETIGLMKVETPDGDTVTKEFNSFQNVQGRGTTDQGDKFYTTSGTVRTKVSGRAFNYRQDIDTDGRNIINDRSRDLSQVQEADLRRSGLEFSGNREDLEVVDIDTSSSDTETVGEATNVVFGKRSAEGSSGSGQGLVSGSGDGGVEAGSASSISGSFAGGEAFSVDVESLTRVQLRNYYDGGSGAAGGASAGLASEVDTVTGSSPQENEASLSQVESASLQTGSVEVNRVQSRTGGGQTGSQEVASRAKEMNQQFVGGGQDDVGKDIAPEVDTEPKSDTGQERDFFQPPGQDVNSFQGVGQVNLGVQGLGVDQGLGLEPLQTQVPAVTQRIVPVQTTKVTQTGLTPLTPTPVTPGTPAGGLPLGMERKTGFVSTGSSGTRTGYGVQGSQTLSLLSANAVEQVTGEEAVFPADTEEDNVFSGVKTVQEREGKIDDRKPLGKDFGGDLI